MCQLHSTKKGHGILLLQKIVPYFPRGTFSLHIASKAVVLWASLGGYLAHENHFLSSAQGLRAVVPHE